MRGGDGRRHRLTLPPRLPGGGACPCRACFACRITVFFPLPRRGRIAPQPPSPPRKGEIFWFSYARGFAPCIPGAEPEAAPAIPAPGERTISNAEVPLPRSPLSLAAGTAHQCRVLTATPCRVSERNLNPASQETKPPRREPQRQVEPVPRPVQPWGCKGRSPLHKIT